jgi:cytochrome c2
VGLDNGAADRQSHSHPLRLGRIKGLEETLKALWIQPTPSSRTQKAIPANVMPFSGVPDKKRPAEIIDYLKP